MLKITVFLWLFSLTGKLPSIHSFLNTHKKKSVSKTMKPAIPILAKALSKIKSCMLSRRAESRNMNFKNPSTNMTKVLAATQS